MNIFIRSSRNPRKKKGKRPPRRSRPQFENHWLRITNPGVIRQDYQCWYMRHIGYMSSCTFMYLCALCYCDAHLKCNALRVEVIDFTQYTLSTGSLIPILVLFTSKMQVWTFWYRCVARGGTMGAIAPPKSESCTKIFKVNQAFDV